MAVMDSYEAQQRSILFELNAITERFLSRSADGPASQRRAYLLEIRKLVQVHLNVRFVSVFWRDESGDRVVCLDSTGLWNSKKEPIPAELFANASYGVGEGCTGEVFRSGKPHLAKMQSPPPKLPKYTEVPPDAEVSGVSWIVCPMPFLTGTAGASTPPHPVCGVIRCSDTRSRLLHKPRNFDSIQIETLSFLTRQMTPVLEGMAVNIKRERTVSIVKHDLFAPVRMISDTVTTLSEDLRHNRRPGEYALPNLEMSAHLAKNLIAQLDPDPEQVREFQPAPIYLEGDVIARVSSMLRHYGRVENQMEIHFGDFKRNVPCMMIDRGLIERALFNLVINAVKYGQRGSKIEILPWRKDNGVYVNVLNDGMGVEPDEAERIFHGTYRSPRARKMGLGLGLKIAKSIMEKHGGTLELTSLKNPTVFSLFFPKKLYC